MQLNLHRLWIFLQVVECGGFSAAAQHLYMSQPSVSNQVRQLERSLHTTLIDRSGARIRPTAEGEVLVGYAERIFRLADDAVDAVEQVATLGAGRLVVGATPDIGTSLLPELLADFARRHPGIECDSFAGTTAQVLTQLQRGTIGLALMTGKPAGPPFVSTPVLSERLLLVVASDHRLAGKTVTPQDLTGEHFLLREPGSPARADATEALATWHLTAVEVTEFHGHTGLVRAATTAEGVTIVSDLAIRPELARGDLVLVDVTPPLPPREVHLTHRRDRRPSPAEQALTTHLRATSDVQ